MWCVTYLLQVLVFIGELMDASTGIPSLTDNLLQWSDLLASLYLLGHDVTVKTDRVELLRYCLVKDINEFHSA